jgi:hypothetical protein
MVVVCPTPSAKPCRATQGPVDQTWTEPKQVRVKTGGAER